MYALVAYIYKRLPSLRRNSLEVFGNKGSPDSMSSVSTFFSAIGARLPDEAVWKSAFSADKECQLMIDLISNPPLVKKANLEKLYHIYQAPMHNRLVAIDTGMLN